jgi:hypothetical protein
VRFWHRRRRLLLMRAEQRVYAGGGWLPVHFFLSFTDERASIILGQCDYFNKSLLNSHLTFFWLNIFFKLN